MIISRTPFRVSFFGGGTDYPEFYREHGGAVLCSTIDQYCYLSIHAISQFFQYRFRASYAKTELVQDPREFKHPLIRECLLHLDMRETLEIAHVSDLPARTGLGTSSSFTVGLLHALHALRGDRVTGEDLAREAILIERERVGDAGGHQDQYAAAYGGFIRIDFADHHGAIVRHLPISAMRIRELESYLMLFYLGHEKSADGVVSEQRKRTAQNITALLEMAQMVNVAESILISGSDLKEFGRLLHESWQLKKSLSSGISNSAIDRAYAAARAVGAVGGKLLGGGGRGFLLVFAAPEHHGAIRERLAKLREVSLTFSSHGSEIIFRTPDRGIPR
ncbi:MAG: kinase [bacterium]